MRIPTIARIVAAGLVCGALIGSPAIALADTFSLGTIAELADTARSYASLAQDAGISVSDVGQLYGLWNSTCEFFGTKPLTLPEIVANFPELSHDLQVELADLYAKTARDLAAGKEPTDAAYNRMEDILTIARTKRLEKALSPKEFREYKGLVKEFDALPEGKYLSNAKFARLMELESKDPMEGDDYDSIEEEVAEMEGLTDAERKELIDIYYHDYQDTRRGTLLNDKERTRMGELNLKADLAEARMHLNDAEYAEYEDLSLRWLTDEGLTDEELDRMIDLIIKIEGEGD